MTIVWVPGWATTASALRPLADSLPGRNHRFADVASAVSPGDFLTTLRGQLPTTRTVLVGWSMGGMLCHQLAAGIPEIVTAVIGISTTTRFVDADNNLGWPSSAIADLRAGLTLNASHTIERFTRSMFTAQEIKAGMWRQMNDLRAAEHLVRPPGERREPQRGVTPRGIRSFIELDARQPARNENPLVGMNTVLAADLPPAQDATRIPALQAGLDYLLQTDTIATIQQLPMPALWIHGDADIICPYGGFERTQDASRHRPNHQFVTIPEAGHAPFLTQPDAVANAIREFLADAVD